MKNIVKIAGVPFHPVTYDQATELVREWMGDDRKRYIVTPNPEMILDAQKDEEFKEILKNAGLSVADGTGILWAAHYLFSPKSGLLSSLAKILFAPKSIHNIIPQRVTGSDLFLRIVDESQNHNWRIFLLGAQTGVAARAIDKLLERYPRAVFAGGYSGSPHRSEEEVVRDMITRAEADILFVAYGHPAQEKWIARNLPRLPTVRLAMGVGGAFDFASGKIARAPEWMRKTGLEWLWRLIRQPARIKRIWKATVTFVKFIRSQKKKMQ